MRKIKNFVIILLLLYILLQIITNINEIHQTIFFSYKIFIDNIVPNLFPFLIISNLLINYGFVDMCYKAFNPIMKKLFKIDGNASFIFIMSLLTGFPSNSKYTKDLLLQKRINSLAATKIITFTHFSNPLFIIGTISNFINFNIAVTILLAHYIGNIIVGLLFRNYYIDNTELKMLKTNTKPFGICLLDGVKSAIETLLIIYGTMTFFLIISFTITNTFNLSDLSNTILSGFLEFTQGLKYTSMLSLNIKYKAVLMGMFISFGGLSVHAQILSIISDTEIKYKPFFLARIVHSILTGLIVYFFA